MLQRLLIFSVLLLMQISTNKFCCAQKAVKAEFQVVGKQLIINKREDTLACRVGNEIYFTHKQVGDNGKIGTASGIYIYSLTNHLSKDLKPLQYGDEQQKPTGPIIAILFDAVMSRLYFSTLEGSAASPEYLSWYYDFRNTETIRIFKEGIIKGIGVNGEVDMLMYGTDYKGKYSQRIIYSDRGISYKVSDRVYLIK